MGMVMHNHELFESVAYPYGFAPDVYAWREVSKYRDSDVSASISIEAIELSEDLDQFVNLAGETVIEELVTSLLGLSLSPRPNTPVRLSPVIPTLGALKTLSVTSTGRNCGSVDRRSKGAIPVLNYLLGEGAECASNSALSVASPLATQQQFRSN
ncbi:hypothetical protein AYI68_g5357 [Smittium mucronatum]|uniref:Uncharacterized protein n=1 Tax=Smittium mucronatum TaxID=133383 RepID=A0A1R0GUH6_9FUNG|nr:hypothetical protein AYI68_g5357 [Smittium mucronatum]